MPDTTKKWKDTWWSEYIEIDTALRSKKVIGTVVCGGECVVRRRSTYVPTGWRRGWRRAGAIVATLTLLSCGSSELPELAKKTPSAERDSRVSGGEHNSLHSSSQGLVVSENGGSTQAPQTADSSKSLSDGEASSSLSGSSEEKRNGASVDGPWLGEWVKRPPNAENPLNDRWKLRMTKEGDGFLLVIDKILPTGERVRMETTSARLDGKAYPVHGSDSVDHDIFTRINDRTYGLVDLFGGRETARFVIHISDDDKVRTSTSFKVSDKGEITTTIGVWDRAQ